MVPTVLNLFPQIKNCCDLSCTSFWLAPAYSVSVSTASRMASLPISLYIDRYLPNSHIKCKFLNMACKTLYLLTPFPFTSLPATLCVLAAHKITLFWLFSFARKWSLIFPSAKPHSSLPLFILLKLQLLVHHVSFPYFRLSSKFPHYLTICFKDGSNAKIKSI